MPSLTLLNTLHWLATALLLGSAAAVAYRWWRGWRAGDAAALGQTLRGPWRLAWLSMGVSLLSFPISGWWLVHASGWSLGQTWLLGTSLLYTLGVFCWLWLLARVNRLRVAGPAVSTGQRRLVLGLAIVGAGVAVATLGLMVFKPA